MSLTHTDNRRAQTTLLNPQILASLSNLELVARAVVDGFVMGMHRSPKYGFSQEFVEYRAYAEGDDPRHIDWNVYARTDRTYIKRFLGETNTHLMILLDVSASMGFGSKQTSGISKLQFGKYLAASLAYLASRQHDAIGIMTFNDEVMDFRPPTSRAGSLQGVIHSIDKSEAVQGTTLSKPFSSFRQHIKKRGLIAVISDFYCTPEEMQDNIRPLAMQGHDVMMFHLLDPGEIKPDFRSSTLLEDMETGNAVEVSPAYMKKEYPARVQAHIQAIKEAAQGINADHVLVNTGQPLDQALHAYLTFREKRG